MTATVLPSSNINSKEDRPVRASASHHPKWQRYQPSIISGSGSGGDNKGSKSSSKKDNEMYAYQKQYSHVYSHRLTSLKGRCWESFRLLDSGDQKADTTTIKEVNRVLELQEDVLSRIVGTLVKESNDINEEPILTSSSSSNNNDCRPSDQLYLEDESGRVALSLSLEEDEDDDDSERPSFCAGPLSHSNVTVHDFCTGLVAGVEGTVDATGTLHVRKIVPPAPSPSANASAAADGGQQHREQKLAEPSGQDPHVLLISSLQCGDPGVGTIPREMLISYLQGHFTDDAAKVCRVILAGSGSNPTNPLDGLKELDMVLGRQISNGHNRGGCSLPVDVIPSRDDPTTTNWPQRPIHSSLLPSCSKPMVHCTPNPYAAQIGGTTHNHLVVGTDGLNVRDFQQHTLTMAENNKNSKVKEEPKDHDGDVVVDDSENRNNKLFSFRPISELEALERTLVWSNICPTAPASVGSIPTSDFVLDETPKLYFCGNCEEGFATKLSSSSSKSNSSNKTRLICVPKFHQTGKAVLVNLRTLDVEVLQFQDEVPSPEGTTSSSSSS
eukprot:CAMPEP_0113447232 /NCGR_PEP_ID=MMETSP0014_2-20120614/4129_1 /TAXON_ID=2857 /ORGANISM="Nitzschia sp." /LENGTH=553 /DNA_ID=CAMNT_0000338375 /DNA_START=105 /DNA_END=1766 /DNA_ORIENTATION=+ /assembly_acc=CAM_ASM_000159